MGYGKELNKIDAYELYLYITNDAQLYRGQHSSINKNLTIKKAGGVYNRGLAVKLFKYLADTGAKKYNREFGSGSKQDMFSVKDRRWVAAKLTRDFEHAYNDGDFVEYIPKKYRVTNKPSTYKCRKCGVTHKSTSAIGSAHKPKKR